MTGHDTNDDDEWRARLRVNTQRGTGVRDQDELTGEVRADSLADLNDELPEFLDTITGAMADLRRFQPDPIEEVEVE